MSEGLDGNVHKPMLRFDRGSPNMAQGTYLNNKSHICQHYQQQVRFAKKRRIELNRSELQIDDSVSN
jgi:hypothetical protein